MISKIHLFLEQYHRDHRKMYEFKDDTCDELINQFWKHPTILQDRENHFQSLVKKNLKGSEGLERGDTWYIHRHSGNNQSDGGMHEAIDSNVDHDGKEKKHSHATNKSLI